MTSTVRRTNKCCEGYCSPHITLLITGQLNLTAKFVQCLSQIKLFTGNEDDTTEEKIFRGWIKKEL
jgi:hypothetical protein